MCGVTRRLAASGRGRIVVRLRCETWNRSGPSSSQPLRQAGLYSSSDAHIVRLERITPAGLMSSFFKVAVCHAPHMIPAWSSFRGVYSYIFMNDPPAPHPHRLSNIFFNLVKVGVLMRLDILLPWSHFGLSTLKWSEDFMVVSFGVAWLKRQKKNISSFFKKNPCYGICFHVSLQAFFFTAWAGTIKLVAIYFDKWLIVSRVKGSILC